MDRRIGKLVAKLREAIEDAIGDSAEVAAIMADLEHVGQYPSFFIDVRMPQEREAPSLEMVMVDGPLVLTAQDEEFLVNVGIRGPGVA